MSPKLATHASDAVSLPVVNQDPGIRGRIGGRIVVPAVEQTSVNMRDLYRKAMDLSPGKQREEILAALDKLTTRGLSVLARAMGDSGYNSFYKNDVNAREEMRLPSSSFDMVMILRNKGRKEAVSAADVRNMSPSQFRKFLAPGPETLQVCASGIVRTRGDVACLELVGVARRFRRAENGLGTKLVGDMETAAANRGAKFIGAEVHDRHAAPEDWNIRHCGESGVRDEVIEALYRRLGYKTVDKPRVQSEDSARNMMLIIKSLTGERMTTKAARDIETLIAFESNQAPAHDAAVKFTLKQLQGKVPLIPVGAVRQCAPKLAEGAVFEDPEEAAAAGREYTPLEGMEAALA